MSAIRLGTRGSALALAQARWVAERLGGDVELVEIRTAGDAGANIGDKSRWVDAIESALVAGEIDLAVHSAKDVPGELAEGCAIVATPERAAPHDVLLLGATGGLDTGRSALDQLPDGARVGTASLRRRAQLLARRPDLDVVELRGNVDTRIRKLQAGEADALVLAAAGLDRLDRGETRSPLVLDPFVPAPGQGTLALEARAGDERFARLNDPETFAALSAEREAVRLLGASCHTPVGVWAHRRDDGTRWMSGFAGLPDGSEWLHDEVQTDAGAVLAERMLAAGAAELLARAEAFAA